MRTLSLVLVSLLLLACQRPAGGGDPAIDAYVDTPAKPWTSLTPRDAAEDFHFVVVTDRTGGHRPGVFSGAMPKVNLLQPAFVVSVGDLIEGYTEDVAELDTQWNEIEGFVDQLDAPFFYAAGNHDMSNAVMADIWQQRFGPSYYHFLYKDVLFLVLNSELFGMVGRPDVPVPGPWQQSEQMDFVRHVLGDHPDVRWTVVLIHQPLWDTPAINSDWLEVENLLGTRNYTVFAGHYHRYTKAVRHNRKYITLATTGGGSGLRGPVYGEFDHVAWVTMRSDGPQIANLLLDGIQDENVNTTDQRAAVQSLEQALLVRPAMSDHALFDRGVQQITIRNPGTAPLSASPRILRPGSFVIDGLHPVTVAPGVDHTLALALSSDPSQAYSQLQPAAIGWTLTTEIGGRPLQIEAVTPVLPLTRWDIPSTDVAPTIDGRLRDWPQLPLVADRQGDVVSPAISAADASFRFGVQADAAHVYLGVAVTDDSIVADASRVAREQDSLVISLDARPAAQRNASMSLRDAGSNGDLTSQLILILPLGESAADRGAPFAQANREQVQAAVVASERGYNVELAIPRALLDAHNPDGWNEVRIAISQTDYDADQDAAQVLHWQPYRYGSAPLAGSHTFRMP